jgi:GAF domain-containing protein
MTTKKVGRWVMTADESDILAGEEFRALAEVADMAVTAKSPTHLAEAVLRTLSDLFKADAAILFCADARLANPFFSHKGLSEPDILSIKNWCCERMEGTPSGPSLPGSAPLIAQAIPLQLFPLAAHEKQLGFLGLGVPGDGRPEGPLLARALSLVSHSLANLLDRTSLEKQLYRLNTYMNVSSLIAQALDLRDVLEAVLYFGMEALSAEAASVLLLDYEKKNFRFYSVEGPAKTVLLTATFPADQGLAGSVLRSGRSEVINDVRNDPRFYDRTDAQSGFVTRNVVAVPLAAGEEKIGVLEILNRMDGAPFTEEDRLLLQPIAEEVAFAIRNAKLFEVVVKSYCKQRQGLNTCKDCKRPLGSWTPCVRYREESGLLA